MLTRAKNAILWFTLTGPLSYCQNINKSAESVSFIEKSDQSLWPFHYWINGYLLQPQKKEIVMDDSTIMTQKVRQFKKMQPQSVLKAHVRSFK